MRFLLDTNVLIVLARRELHKLDARIVTAVLSAENLSFASAASLWEIAIKTRLGKLDPGLALDDLPDYFGSYRLELPRYQSSPCSEITRSRAADPRSIRSGLACSVRSGRAAPGDD